MIVPYSTLHQKYNDCAVLANKTQLNLIKESKIQNF